MAGELHGESISDLLVILGAAGIVIPAFAVDRTELLLLLLQRLMRDERIPRK